MKSVLLYTPMVENRVGSTEPLHFKVKNFSNPACDGIKIGNSGLTFFSKGEDWTWHYQPDGNNGPVVGKEIEYSTVFLAAFGEFMDYWRTFDFPKGNKPDLVQSLTNPTMANFIMREFKNGLVTTPGNSYAITFDLSAIDADESLLATFDLAQKRCSRQAYRMIKA